MKTRILMVCLGNICRSPLAEGILKSKVDPNKIFVDSAGTSNYHVDDSPDPRSIAIAREKDLDITSQRGRQFSVKDFDNFDRIYVMDMSNYHDVISLARSEEDRKKVSLILNEIFPEENVEVPDPYHGGTDGFTKVYEMLDEACEVIAQKHQ
ncbi:MAG: low molecular weight protein-tyrosine-phosphatase [Salinimicrobium sediminis]|uniref:protein-tyrosine-phosphatase n=1 Tax=Salinimicrobium sediminis TaxID=1343891 RepID=A0A285X757_9FLAO|nr:low molecular weight protein-tyrosine-phosphatase [Salinimicrobium sediminis]MDX1602912.1 low molecular weight protein-tyrosine-phosphatase [Salinimicrobium sediminis]MDX1752242.1 low molecular weight protein-tyrosine-phosphatase [Salinimicrobium sediminis]SOC80614.1 protein-tyrosine phosphatase [Salinimicrobium sediminis]